MHWQAPITANGVLYLPDHAKHLSAYAPPPTVSRIEIVDGGNATAVKVTGTGFTPSTSVGINDKGAEKLNVLSPTKLTFTADSGTMRTASITIRNGVGQTVVAEVSGKGTTAPPMKPDATTATAATVNGAIIVTLAPPDGTRQIYAMDSGSGCGPVIVPLEPFAT